MEWDGSESQQDGKGWPTAATRLNWARNNYKNLDVQQLVQKMLRMQLNLIALDDLFEEKSGEGLLTKKLRTRFIKGYETWRPTKPVGRPKGSSETGQSV